MSGWESVYKQAIQSDGSLFFPERLSQEFLDQVKKTQGSYLFANQYQNELIPEDEQVFKPKWFRYWDQLPDRLYNFGFIDPAISQEEHADYTALTVVGVDCQGDWYLRHASRQKINPTKVVQLAFDVCREYDLRCLGIEDIAFQKALLYMIDSEMKARNVVIPVKGVPRGTDLSKEMRIMGLVPRFEWGRIYLKRGYADLETELLQFPRGSHDDLVDSLASIEQIAHKPQKEKIKDEQPNIADAAAYESWYRRQLEKRQGTSEY